MNNEINDIESAVPGKNGLIMPPGPEIFQDAIPLLKQLISTPSFSKEEEKTATALENFLKQKNIKVNRSLNNVWALNKYFDPNKFTILLNSHHDTVKPNGGYTIDPFAPFEEEGKLYGLGSNDAGGALVSLVSVFVHFYSIAKKCNF